MSWNQRHKYASAGFMDAGVIDLDRRETWPAQVCEEIDKRVADLIRERLEQRAYDLSGDRWHKSSPPKPSTDLVTDLINRTMASKRLRVFHATRLLGFDEIRKNGLRTLRYAERIERLKQLAAGPLAHLPNTIDEIIADANLASNYFAYREAMVWATPLRRSLHDGGCDVFFENWGGEAVQRIAELASPELAAAIRTVGTPAVVVVCMPAFGFCKMADLRLAPTMIDLALERDGSIEVAVGSWDVRAEANVPPEWIEDVLPHDHASLLRVESGRAGSQ